VQREMGKNTNNFIPVKYSNSSDENTNAIIINMFVGALFVAFFYNIYKNRNGKMSTGKSTGKP